MLLEKDLLETAATIKRFEYSPLGSELKNKLTLQKKKKEYQRLDKVYELMKQ